MMRVDFRFGACGSALKEVGLQMTPVSIDAESTALAACSYILCINGRVCKLVVSEQIDLLVSHA